MIVIRLSEEKETPQQRLQLLKLTTKALKTFPGSPKQKEIQKDINALRKKMNAI